jgi:hypothetical protein
MWTMAWQWHHVSLQYKTNAATDHLCQIVLNWKILHIVWAKSCETENYHIHSKSGINFQVVLKWNHAKRNHVKLDLPTLTSWYNEYIYFFPLKFSVTRYVEVLYLLLKHQYSWHSITTNVICHAFTARVYQWLSYGFWHHVGLYFLSFISEEWLPSSLGWWVMSR